ncbi:MAG: LuxR family transcriptional regulator, partial [Spirochaetaceae bacterium]
IMSEIKLTAREEEIIELVLEGASNREIGERLFISEPTVKSHIYNAYRKLGISSRMELVQLIK